MEYIIFKEHFVVLQTQMLFVDAFLQNNRLDHVTQLMGYHPNYLEMFLRTQQYLLRGDGPLPFHYRHYIAIMVSHTWILIFFWKSHIMFVSNNGGKKDDSENFPFMKKDVLYTNSSVNIDFFFLWEPWQVDCSVLWLVLAGCQSASVCVSHPPSRAGVYPSRRGPRLAQRTSLHPYKTQKAPRSQQNPGTSTVAV